jgi:hypothetical protein
MHRSGTDLQLLAGTQLPRQCEQLRTIVLALFLRAGVLSHFEIDGVDRILVQDQEQGGKAGDRQSKPGRRRGRRWSLPRSDNR